MNNHPRPTICRATSGNSFCPRLHILGSLATDRSHLIRPVGQPLIARATAGKLWVPDTSVEGWLSLVNVWSHRDLAQGRDPRFITIRRGGRLTDPDHRLLGLWAAACAEHVLHLFESVQPSDPRPRQAVEQIRAWARGEIRMSQSRSAGGHAMTAARALRGAARHAAFAAGQAAVVAHVAAHELGAAAYAIKAARAAAPAGDAESVGRLECSWQREQLPPPIRELVMDDQRLRNEICWAVFDC